MLLNHDFMDKWERIVNEIDKEQVPIQCIKKVIFRTTDRKQKTINLKKLQDQGFDIKHIDEAVARFIQDHQGNISSMEFVLDIGAVAETVQPYTDELLKSM